MKQFKLYEKIIAAALDCNNDRWNPILTPQEQVIANRYMDLRHEIYKRLTKDFKMGPKTQLKFRKAYSISKMLVIREIEKDLKGK